MVRALLKQYFCLKLADRATNRLFGASGNFYPGSKVWTRALQDLLDPPDRCQRRIYILPGYLHVSLRIRNVTDIFNGENFHALDSTERYTEISLAKHSTRAICVRASV